MKVIIKPIKSHDDYLAAIACMEELVALDPEPGTEKSDQMLILGALVENYEKTNFPIDPPSAIEAIKFRMEQLNMKISDLAPYVGSVSRASEILSRKRHLTVGMIRALSTGLHIPEKALLKDETDSNEFSQNIPNAVFRRMIERGYFNGRVDVKNKACVLKEFFSRIKLQPNALLYRRSGARINDKTSLYALVAWSNHVLEKGRSDETAKLYDRNINLDFMRKIVKLSIEENGPQLAIRELSDNGITVIIEPPLDSAKVDGITIMQDKTHPIIGLSLRYDRLDNFWFTLMHELAHIALHLDHAEDFIYDDLDCPAGNDDKEKQADELASEALVDTAEWLTSPARIIPSPLAAQALADKLGIHIAIVAGKARFEDGNWKYLSNVVNKYKIREKFGDIKW